jgi:hypothetical protein
LGITRAVTDAWTVGLSGIVTSGQYLSGDEANLDLKTDPYGALNAHSHCRVPLKEQLFCATYTSQLNTNYVTGCLRQI